MKIVKTFKNTARDMKTYPSAVKMALLSLLIPGLGQWKNKQRYKTFLFLGAILFFVLIEVLTSDYLKVFTELSQYPPGEKFYFFRDYGGVITYGLWGFITLGELVIGAKYRGANIRLVDYDIPWISADSSPILLGKGAIALVFFAIFIAIWYANVKDAFKSRVEIEQGKPQRTWREFKKYFWDEYFAYIIIAPAVILLLFFVIVPFIYSFSIAFTSYTYKIKATRHLIDWVGFDTFFQVFKNKALYTYFLTVLKWTVFYAFMSSFTVYVIGFINALIIESKYVKGKKIFRLLLIIPWAIPAMITLMVARIAFTADGLFNQILIQTNTLESAKQFLQYIGLMGQQTEGVISFLTHYANANLAKFVIILVNLWSGAPYFMMLIIGILGTIPASLYEASQIDGASGPQQFRYITLPWVIRATLPVIITTFTFNFNNFGAIFFLTGGGPGYHIDKIPAEFRGLDIVPGQTDILISWIYKMSFGSNALYNIASVYSILIFIFIGSFAIFNLARVKSFWEED